jgi:vacuolar-type H+-ATPase subunit I/STV1
MTGGQDYIPLGKDEIISVAREISSFNDAYNAYFALNVGKYFSRNETFIQEGLNWQDAAAMIAGLTRRDIADARLMIISQKDQQAAQRHVMEMAEKEVKRAFTAGADDIKKFDFYMARAKAMMVSVGDLRDEQIRQVIDRAISENTPLVERLKKQFAERGYKSQLPARWQRLFDTR